MDGLTKRKALRASAMALSTIQTISFEGLPDVTVKMWPEGKGAPTPARWSKQGNSYLVEHTMYDSIDEWRAKNGETGLRHEFFHHFLEAGGVTYDQKCELFELAHQVAPNGSFQYVWAGALVPRYWPNEDKTDPGCKWWLGGGDSQRRAGEDFAYLLQEMYDGQDDGIANVSRPNFAGRKIYVSAATRKILERAGVG